MMTRKVRFAEQEDKENTFKKEETSKPDHMSNIKMNSILISTKPENLPDVDEFPGVSFILETSKSPRLIEDKNYKFGTLRYHERDRCNEWWFMRILYNSPYYFNYFWYPSRKGQRVSCTREEICFAWVTALNNSRYHKLLEYSVQMITDSKIRAKYQTSITELSVMAEQWRSLFREIDWALGILWQMQQDRILPSSWKNRTKEYDITKLSEFDEHLTFASTAKDLTGIFLHATRQVIYLHKRGQVKGLSELALITGFKGHKICQVPGIPKEMVYDEDFVLINN